MVSRVQVKRPRNCSFQGIGVDGHRGEGNFSSWNSSNDAWAGPDTQSEFQRSADRTDVADVYRRRWGAWVEDGSARCLRVEISEGPALFAPLVGPGALPWLRRGLVAAASTSPTVLARTPRVPDSGSTEVLCGFGLLGLATLRVRWSGKRGRPSRWCDGCPPQQTSIEDSPHFKG
ncbi:MAG TPA: hypothetical protein DCE44_20455 [Verrucomicrobiales bacterium]|nr:hypothetical protein [Verrucomicrobiales bacterium]